MDGRVGAIRAALDAAGCTDDARSCPTRPSTPRRSTAPSARRPSRRPQFGDRRGYQMDPANGREALREAALDVAEGADMVMVKPAAAYLDVIAAVRDGFDLPLAAYNVSGEYAMIKAAAERGWLDERARRARDAHRHPPRRRRHHHHLLRQGRRPVARRGGPRRRRQAGASITRPTRPTASC